MRLAAILGLAACLTSLSAQGQEPAANGIAGRVLNAEGKPLKDAIVTLLDFAQPRAMETRADGLFRFESLPTRDFEIHIHRTGYVDAHKILAGRTPTAAMEFRLFPEAVIAGRVLNVDGEPIAGYEVQVMHWQYREGKRGLLKAGETGQTGADGSFAIGGLASGTYFVVVFPPWREGTALVLREQYPIAYFPGTNTFSEAQPLQVDSGQRITADLIVRPSPMSLITVKVESLVAGAISLYARGSTPFLQQSREDARSGKDGRLRLPLLPRGEILLQAMVQGSTPAYAVERVFLDHDSEVTLTIRPSFAVSGRINIVGPRPERLPGLRVRAASTADLPSYVDSIGTMDAKGEFQLQQLGPAPYSISMVELPRGGYIRSVRLGSEDVTNRFSTFAPGVSLDIDVSLNSAEITGVVRDAAGKPVAGARVAIWKPGVVPPGVTPPVTAAFAGPDGRYRMKTAFPAGDYVVLASPGPDNPYGDAGPFQYPPLRSLLDDIATPVHIGEDGTVTLDPAFVPDAALHAAEAKLGGR